MQLNPITGKKLTMLKKNKNTQNLNLIILTLISFDLEINSISKSKKTKNELRKYLQIHDFSGKNINQFNQLIFLLRDFELNKKIIREINEYFNYLNLENHSKQKTRPKKIIEYKLQHTATNFIITQTN
tara:strand:- start:7233 stop:7616 length:384 start_codon:yes stop_codon:yes gene_type:complete